ncbi:MAG TPA: DASS family sodium-coupled anion symporter [Saprospiraceae bacterium]|nr:DASS family sodium-coupled anion symporter [Saprospiraceae bacterium]
MAGQENIQAQNQGNQGAVWIRVGFWAGPLLFLFLWQGVHPAGMSQEAIAVMAVTVWIAVWWVSECVPLPVTSLLPILLFPLLKISNIGDTTSAYGHPLVFLYIGGFLLAIAIEKTGLHNRIAINIIRSMGVKLHMIILGFMISTAFLSMWISNTATAVMMLPIGLAIIKVASGRENETTTRFNKALMLAIAYAASIGGVATLIGTPPNLVLAGVVRDMYQTEISFLQWFMVGFPLAVVLLLICWFYLTRIGFPLGQEVLLGGHEEMNRRHAGLGAMSFAEKSVTVVFITVALAWICRSFILQRFIPAIDDTIIAMAAGIILFLLPSGQGAKGNLLVWEDAVKLPWGIILLFGGGMALADAFESSGLAVWIGGQMTGLSVLGVFLVILLVVTIVNFLTEFTSNLATVTMILPVLAPIAIAAGIHPFMLMVAATMAASCGFMMPAGTPPNAIAFGSGYLRIWDMVRTGFVMNVISILLITALIYFLLENLWHLV